MNCSVLWVIYKDCRSTNDTMNLPRGFVDREISCGKIGVVVRPPLDWSEFTAIETCNSNPRVQLPIRH
jgi:hypothetical protein